MTPQISVRMVALTRPSSSGGDVTRECPAAAGERVELVHQAGQHRETPERTCRADALAEPPRREPGRERAGQGGRVDQADHPRHEADFAAEEDDHDRQVHRLEEARQRVVPADGPQHRIAADHPKTFADLAEQVPLAGFRPHVVRPDPPQPERREEVADGVGGQRRRVAQGLHDEPGQARARHRGHGQVRREPGVGVGQLLARDQPRHVRLVGDVEEHRQQADTEDGRQQLGQPEDAEQRRDRDRADQRGPAEVRGDQHRPVAHAVAPRAGLQPS